LPINRGRFYFLFSVRCPSDETPAVRATLAEVINSNALILGGAHN
jgi:hypothetical protein